MNAAPARGLIAIDKMGGKVLFLDPESYATTHVLDDFERNPHELFIAHERATAYIPIFGNGVHGRNPKPGHVLSVVDLHSRRHAGDIDLAPYIAPHGLHRAPDGLLYVTCENSGVVAIVDIGAQKVVGAIETGSTNSHRMAMSPDGQFLYTENEEDASVSVLDIKARKLVRQIATPHPLAGIAASADSKWLVAVSDNEPVIFLIDAATHEVVRTIPLRDVPKAAQIARFSPDGRTLLVTSVQGGTATLLDASFSHLVTLTVGRQPMDGIFRGERIFVACQGDGSVHVIDVAARQVERSFSAGTGCETLGFF
jgi:DNA-binding beta-propeller fold protein YncE